MDSIHFLMSSPITLMICDIPKYIYSTISSWFLHLSFHAWSPKFIEFFTDFNWPVLFSVYFVCHFNIWVFVETILFSYFYTVCRKLDLSLGQWWGSSCRACRISWESFIISVLLGEYWYYVQLFLLQHGSFLFGFCTANLLCCHAWSHRAIVILWLKATFNISIPSCMSFPHGKTKLK
jgi:hypothetical protein